MRVIVRGLTFRTPCQLCDYSPFRTAGTLAI